MYNIKLENYVPQPNPVTTDRIIAAHYYSAWKKGAAQIHDGFNELHEYPERTPLMGYYDEENPEVCDWEIKWAVEHGINCFIHCWYRKKDNTGKPVTERDLRCGHGLHEALFNAKYQKYMKFAIMFEASERWAGTDEQDLLENLMPFWMETYFKRGNYLIIDNKPVLLIFNQPRLTRDSFPNPADQKRAFDKCREYAKKAGFDGMYFGVENRSMKKDAIEDAEARGYDFRFGYLAGYLPEEDFPPAKKILIEQHQLLRDKLSMDPKHFVATLSCFWDPTPRYSQKWIDMGYHAREWGKIWYLKPEEFRILIKKYKEELDKLPPDAWANKLLMVDNWNEWDEGHFVAPSLSYGFKFLQAIRQELTACDNLPDYRSPQDMGFAGYNKSWLEP
ncbi:MAG: glycoside hydrolase family 99-like domain-containing protein [Clostridia bacterium]|nr:glycoside hydrolase family 99-like domain-containing protein [Clostridia bacterium]